MYVLYVHTVHVLLCINPPQFARSTLINYIIKKVVEIGQTNYTRTKLIKEKKKKRRFGNRFLFLFLFLSFFFFFFFFPPPLPTSPPSLPKDVFKRKPIG